MALDKITQGRWTLYEGVKETPRLQISASGNTLVYIGWAARPDSGDGAYLTPTQAESVANARMMTAAPALFEALQDLLGWESIAPQELIDTAKNAIHLAEFGAREESLK